MKFIFLYTLLLSLHFSSKAQNEGLINSNGSKLHYRIYGKGIPILVINGGPGMNSDRFASLALQLSKNYQVILYDQRGTGKSIIENPNASNITISLMIEDIENLRKYLKIDSWIILGIHLAACWPHIMPAFNLISAKYDYIFQAKILDFYQGKLVL